MATSTVEIKNCRTLKQVTVGDTLVLRPLGNAAHGGMGAIQVTVTKIARKYFYVRTKWCVEYKFPIDGGQFYDQDSNYGYIPYPSKEAYDEDTKADRMLSEIRKYFLSLNSTKLPNTAIQDIYRILVDAGELTVK